MHAMPAGAQSLRVEWTGQRLTIAADDVPLATVLTEVARQTGSSVVGLEQASDRITVDIRDVTLSAALRTMLADKNYIYIQRYSEATHAYDRVKLWLYRTSAAMASARPCAGTGAGCDEPGPGVVAFDGAVPTFTTEPFPRGASPAESEVARLQARGAFDLGAPEASLLESTKAADPGVRIRALETLAVKDTRAGRAAIAAALDDEDVFVRSAALNLMVDEAEAGGDATRRIGDLLDHRDPTARFSAVAALGEQSSAESEYQLRRALGDPDESVKRLAAQLLEQRERAKRSRDRK